MYSLTNRLSNRSSRSVWCAYSAPDPNGGEWDIWRVRLLYPGRRVTDLDIDYICPEPDDYVMNRKVGWWKLTQMGKFTVCDNEQHDGLTLLSTSGHDVYPYDDWARGEHPSLVERLRRAVSGKKGVDSQAEIDKQKAEWNSLKDWATPLGKRF